MDPLGTGGGPKANDPSRIESLLVWLAVAATVLLCVIVTATVVTRWLGLRVIPDDVLLVRELMVAVILLPLAAVTGMRAHISVTVFSSWLGGRGQVVLAVIGHLAGVGFTGLLMWAGWRLFSQAWTSGGYYDGDIYVRKWVGNGTFLIGLAAFLTRLAVMLVNDIRLLFSGGARDS